MSQQEAKITGALINPALGCGRVMVNGASVAVIALHHPQLGRIDCIVDDKIVHEFIGNLTLMMKPEGRQDQ